VQSALAKLHRLGAPNSTRHWRVIATFEREHSPKPLTTRVPPKSPRLRSSDLTDVGTHAVSVPRQEPGRMWTRGVVAMDELATHVERAVLGTDRISR
jgi:hypothetical protein